MQSSTDTSKRILVNYINLKTQTLVHVTFGKNENKTSSHMLYSEIQAKQLMRSYETI